MIGTIHGKIKRYALAAVAFVVLAAVLLLAACASDGTGTDDPLPSEKTYSVVYKVNDEDGGFLRGDAEQQVTHGGDGKIVTAVPLGGYVFLEWSDGYKQPERQDKNVDKDMELIAKFEKRYAVSYFATGNGRIDGKSTQKVKPNGNADSVTAIPDDGYEFAGWSDGYKIATRTDKNIVGDLNIAAVFAKKQLSLSYSASSHGRIEGKTEQKIKWGDSAESVTAIPDEGYEFSHWSDSVDRATRIDENVKKNIDVFAVFKRKELTVVYSAAENGSIDGVSTQTVLYGDSATCVTAKPDLGYEFIEWSDGVTTASRTDAAVKNDINVTAKFGKIVNITVTYGVNGGGSISGKTTQTVAWGGTTESVTAVANAGYKFVGWSDDITTAQRHDANIMPSSSNIVINAIFEYDNPPDIDDILLFSIDSEKTSYSVKARHTDITEAVIPAYYNGLPVVEIMDNGFGNCTQLATVCIPDTLTRIGVNAFVNCSELISINGMSNVETIGHNAFAMCEKLDGIVLPKTLKSLGRRILFGVANRVYTRLTVAELNALNPEWNDKRADGGTVEYIGDASVYLYKQRGTAFINKFLGDTHEKRSSKENCDGDAYRFGRDSFDMLAAVRSLRQ